MFEVEKGYVVTSKGDTINGQVRFRSSYLINFKEEKTGKKYALNPKQYIAAVNGKNEYYQALTVTIDGVSQDVFMQYLMDGDVAFYQFTDETNENTFYIKKQGGENLRKLNKLNYNFIRKKYLVNCDSTYNGKKIGQSDFRRNIVEHQISTHNKRCSPVSNPFSIKYNDKKRSLKFGVNVGYNASFINYYNYYAANYVEFNNNKFMISEAYYESGSYSMHGAYLGGILYFPFSKNFIYNPEINLILKAQNAFLQQNNFSDRYSSSINIEMTFVSLTYRTNKFKVNPNFNIGFPFIFLNTNDRANFTQCISYSSGVDFKISKYVFSKIYFKYMFNGFVDIEGFKLKDFSQEMTNFQIGHTLIF